MIEVVYEDILHQDVDAIVNPANEDMGHGGGLAALIAHTAGPDVVRDSVAQAPIQTGAAIHTDAGNLPFKGIIHAVGPRWRGGDANEDELLRLAHLSAMSLADAHGHTSLAFPAVSCGIFHFPVWRAAPIAVKAVRDAQEQTSVERVFFCLLDDDHYDAFTEALL